MLMLMYSIYQCTNLVTKNYDGCAMRVVFRKLQNCADFSDGDFNDNNNIHIKGDMQRYITKFMKSGF